MERSKIKPFTYFEDGGIPIFKPSMEEFKDFNLFIKSVMSYGRKAGVIKIIPPKPWKNLNTELESKLLQLSVKRPTRQHFVGSRGIFEQLNIQTKKTYSVEDFVNLSKNRDYKPPEDKSKETSSNSKTTSLLNESSLQDDKCYTPELLKFYERKYWSNIAFIPPLYGADTLGTLFDKDITVWNLNDLGDLLKQITEQLPGVNAPYLYFGMWRATFSWHTEDMDLFSINYIHKGAPKQWYVIPTSQKEKFEKLMSTLFKSSYTRCKEFLRHKTSLVSPKVLESYGILVQRVVQYEGEFIITFPQGYHAGYNLGFNVAESVNFATEYWVPIGRKAKICQCQNDSVNIHMSLFDDLKDTTDDSFIDVSGPSCKESDAVSLKRKMNPFKDVSNIAKVPDTKKSLSLETLDSDNDTELHCTLCHKDIESPMLKSFRGNIYAHRVCAQFTPGIKISYNEKSRSNCLIGLNAVLNKRKTTISCCMCFSYLGVTISCRHPDCHYFLHAVCVPREKLVSTPTSQTYCPLHLQLHSENSPEPSLI